MTAVIEEICRQIYAEDGRNKRLQLILVLLLIMPEQFSINDIRGNTTVCKIFDDFVIVTLIFIFSQENKVAYSLSYLKFNKRIKICENQNNLKTDTKKILQT